MLPGMELMGCHDLAVPADVMHHVVSVESSFNPYAIGVVGGRLVRQPGNLSEALATARMLESRGYNFSLGLAQVNRYNLAHYGLASYEQAFQACPNLQAGSRILADCHQRSGRDWGKSFSCYYSGNFVTGFRQGYVQKIYASMRRSVAPTFPGAIAVYGSPARRVVPVSRYPVSSPTNPVAASSRIELIAPPGAPSGATGVPASARSSVAGSPSTQPSAESGALVVLRPGGEAPRVIGSADTATETAMPAVGLPPRDAAFVF